MASNFCFRQAPDHFLLCWWLLSGTPASSLRDLFRSLNYRQFYRRGASCYLLNICIVLYLAVVLKDFGRMCRKLLVSLFRGLVRALISSLLWPQEQVSVLVGATLGIGCLYHCLHSLTVRVRHGHLRSGDPAIVLTRIHLIVCDRDYGRCSCLHALLSRSVARKMVHRLLRRHHWTSWYRLVYYAWGCFNNDSSSLHALTGSEGQTLLLLQHLLLLLPWRWSRHAGPWNRRDLKLLMRFSNNWGVHREALVLGATTIFASTLSRWPWHKEEVVFHVACSTTLRLLRFHRRLYLVAEFLYGSYLTVCLLYHSWVFRGLHLAVQVLLKSL